VGTCKRTRREHGALWHQLGWRRFQSITHSAWSLVSKLTALGPKSSSTRGRWHRFPQEGWRFLLEFSGMCVGRICQDKQGGEARCLLGHRCSGPLSTGSGMLCWYENWAGLFMQSKVKAKCAPSTGGSRRSAGLGTQDLKPCMWQATQQSRMWLLNNQAMIFSRHRGPNSLCSAHEFWGKRQLYTQLSAAAQWRLRKATAV
jgi:hypothetical protein